MPLTRLRQASDDPLTSRLALGLAGAIVGVLGFWAAVAARPQPVLHLLFLMLAALGLYLVTRAIFKRASHARAVLMNPVFRPLGFACLALAIPLAALIRGSHRSG